MGGSGGEAGAEPQVLAAGALLDTLRAAGAGQVEPIRWHFMEALARRTETQHGATRQRLEARLLELIAEYQALAVAAGDRAPGTPRAAEAAAKLANPLAEGAEAAATTEIETASAAAPGPLAELLAYIAQRSAELAPAAAMEGTGGAARAELKALRYFRNTWAKLSVDQQVAQALAQPPENAGPLNSHLLVLRSLKLMRDVAPDYLNRFLSYVDTLLWLDEAAGGGVLAARNVVLGDGDRKRPAPRGRARPRAAGSAADNPADSPADTSSEDAE